MDQLREFVDRTLLRRIPRTHVGIGVAVLSIIFMLGWTSGLKSSTALCATDDTSDCDPMSILSGMVFAMGQVWGAAFLIVLVMLVVETIVVGTIGKPIMPHHRRATTENGPMLSVRIMFSWMLEPRMLAAVTASFAASAVFAFCYVAWLNMRGSDGATLRQAVRDIYVFQLASFVVFVVAQMQV